MLDTSYTHDERVIVHHIEGALVVREIVRMTQATNSKAVRAVVWDLTNAVFELDDKTYQVSIATTAQFAKQAVPRLLVTHGEQHHQRVKQFMGLIQPPWPWIQFRSMDEAQHWLEALLLEDSA